MINSSCLFGQDGFIDTFRYRDSLPVWNENAVYSSDHNTIILTGFAREPEISNQGIYLREIDTLGNLLRDTLILDPSGGFHHSYDFYPALFTSDNRLLILGSSSESIFMHMYIIDYDFNLIEKIFYPHDTQLIRTSLYTNIFEVSDGFILHLAKQHLNYNIKQHLLKIDKEGQVVWEKEYGESIYNYHSLSTSTLQNERIYISGARSLLDSGEVTIRKFIMEIDLEGNLLNEHYFEPEAPTKFVLLGPMAIDSEGNIIAETSIETWIDNFPESRQLEISKYDQDFNLIWNRKIGVEATWNRIGAKTITIDKEDNIIASGNLLSDDRKVNPSWLIKLSIDGDVIWERRDSIGYAEGQDASNRSRNTTEKHIILESGSIVLAGTLKNSELLGGEINGYVIKVDKDGCLEPGCRTSVNVHSIQPDDSFDIVPNPSTGRFEFRGKYTDAQLTDVYGNAIPFSSLYDGERTLVEVQNYSSGVYYFTYSLDGRRITKKVMLIAQ